MKVALIILLTLNSAIAQEQNSIEQTATDYFFDEIFSKDFYDEKSIKFESTTKPYYLWAITNTIENWDEDLLEIISSKTPRQPVEVNPNRFQKRIRRGVKPSKTPLISVYSAVQVQNRFYVPITVYVKNGFVQHYFLVFNEKSTFIDYFIAGEII